MSEREPRTQYKTTKNLAKRGDFNARYSTFSWFAWLADQVTAPEGTVLDIGCGPGWFWRSVADRWRPERLILADISEAMLQAAQARLAEHYNTETVVADVNALPFADHSVDTVVAMHMLYHSADPPQALTEIARVLKPGGQAIITTVSDDDLPVMVDLSKEIFGSSGTDLILPVFGGKRAATLLPDAFAEVDHRQCKDIFRVDDSDAALDYITSFPPGISAPEAQRGDFHRRFEALRQQGGGVVEMPRLQELFICR